MESSRDNTGQEDPGDQSFSSSGYDTSTTLTRELLNPILAGTILNPIPHAVMESSRDNTEGGEESSRDNTLTRE